MDIDKFDEVRAELHLIWMDSTWNQVKWEELCSRLWTILEEDAISQEPNLPNQL